MESKSFVPSWYEEQAPLGSYRRLFKWGDVNTFKHPDERFFTLLKNTFGMTDNDFLCRQETGLEPVITDVPSHLTPSQVDALRAIVGDDNIKQDSYNRLRVSYGKGMIDLIRMRKEIIENLPDAVLYPNNKNEIEQIVSYCDSQHIPIYVFGGGSSVTRGTEAVKGGISLDMSVHMKRVVEFNEVDQTITVEAGMLGPQLEQILNDAPQLYNSINKYTCGHFPQSFEFSSVGGWVVTKGAGQNSTYYGKIEDIVLAQEYVTPTGTFTTHSYPRAAIGPDLNQIMMGSEGIFGVLVNVTLKIFRNTSANRKYFAFMFKNWEDAQNAVREIMQSEFGSPSIFRLSDAEETDLGLKLYNLEGSIADVILRSLGFQPMKRCLLLGTTDGELGFTININRKIKGVCTNFKSFDLSGFNITQHWEENRWRDPYLREDLQDYGIITDTIECAVTWSQMEKVHSAVRSYIKSRPNTICTAHLSHAYPQGGNLYFIFIAKISDLNEYLSLQYGILDTIQANGAAMSHHHGVGKQTAPWFAQQAGELRLGVVKSLKRYFDPHNIMNPGGTLGLDMTANQSDKRWGIS
ncbi:MAG: FAD-binding oxidoreductase [Chloroflexota bacterium]